MGRWRLMLLAAMVLVLGGATVSVAADGDLDPTFAGDGIAVAPLPERGYGRGAAVDADGRIVAVGFGGETGGLAVVRYMPDGTLDTTFSGDGMVVDEVTPDDISGRDVVIDGEGRIVVVGRSGHDLLTRPAVVRFLPDGDVDTAFSEDGVDTPSVGYFEAGFSGVALDSEGRIVIAGSGAGSGGYIHDLFVVRYLTDGTLDSSFANEGVFLLDSSAYEQAMGLAIDALGRIVVAGSYGEDYNAQQSLVLRLLPDGRLDDSFGLDGIVTEAIGSDSTVGEDVVIDGSGRIVLTGFTNGDTDQIKGDAFVVRYLADGTLDTSFDGDGVVTTAITTLDDGGLSVGIDLVGNVVVVGIAGRQGYSNLALLRYRPDGMLDPTFSEDGIVVSSLRAASSVAIDIRGDIVVTTTEFEESVASMVVARFEGAGRFVDDAGSVFEDDIDTIGLSGITRGCNPPLNDRFCPYEYITRGQMAAFLHRALGEIVDPVRNPVDFTDDDDSIFEPDIAWLSSTGLTAGCNPPANDHYCPEDTVTRGQMAAFLVRALGYTDGGAGDLFVDDDGSIFEEDIDKLATAGVTVGCNPPTNDRYCPDDSVTRGQMAAFLVRALGLG